MATPTKHKIPVRVVPPGTMLREAEEELRVYEVRYEMSSEKMATLLSLDAIRPTAEVLRMVFHLPSAAQIAPRKDPHDWNSWDHYQTIHENRLSEHPFVVSFLDTLAFTDASEGAISLRGYVHCQKDVLLRVRKEFESRYFGQTLRVRCYTYAYIAWLPGEHLLLKYHNIHEDGDEYHHRIYDPDTGIELHHEVLERYQFPVFTEVLDELEALTQDL